MNVQRTTLSNGLRVLVQEVHTAPVVTVWMWYHVGSRHEHTGITGVSHWLEHMLFKGSERWPGNSADHAIAREGGISNAMTWYDFTTYYQTLPATRLALALDIEADRAVSAGFLPSDVESERGVIISERQGNENSPLFLLGEAVSGTAFRVHPYGHQTIGHLCDLQGMTYEDLEAHYRSYYHPGNAVLTIAGDLDPAETQAAAERYFGNLPVGVLPRPRLTQEPHQRGERRLVIEGGGQTDYIAVAFHIPEARHPHFWALVVLNAVLTGGAGFMIGRGSLTNHTSRLYQALVAQELAIDIDGDIVPTVDPGLYRLAATVGPGRKPAEVEQALLAEVDRLQSGLVSTEELAKAQRQARALFAYASESITHQGFWMGFTDIFADLSWYEHYLENLDAVSAEDVLQVAQTYLTASNRTAGWYRSGAA